MERRGLEGILLQSSHLIPGRHIVHRNVGSRVRSMGYYLSDQSRSYDLFHQSEAESRASPSAAKANKLLLFFWHGSSTVMYSFFEIEVPNPLPPPQNKAAQDAQIKKPIPLFPILQLQTGEFPNLMSCVQLGSKLYLFGGEFNINDPFMDKHVKNKLQKEKERDCYPRDVYIFDLNTHNTADKSLDELLVHGTPMNSGKPRPHAFVADEKIYVVGSRPWIGLDDEIFHYFEVYDPVIDKWNILPNPPATNLTSWIRHAVVGSKVLLVAVQRGRACLYCFDLHANQWTKCPGLPFQLDNFYPSTDFVEDTLYGCDNNTIAALAPLAKEEEVEVEVEEEEGQYYEEEEEEGEEKEEVQHADAGWLKYHRIHLVSREMGMDAIFNVPLQSDCSYSMLHLGNRQFCYVRSGISVDVDGNNQAILDDKRRFFSIVIFQALKETYKEDSTRLFRAKFLHSAHYVVDSPVSTMGFIEGCFSPGWDSQSKE